MIYSYQANKNLIKKSKVVYIISPKDSVSVAKMEKNEKRDKKNFKKMGANQKLLNSFPPNLKL